MGEYTTAEKAMGIVKSGDHVFIHSVAAAPQELVRTLTAMAGRLRDVKTYHIHIEGNADFADPKYKDSFTDYSMFVGANVRNHIQNGFADYIPVFLSETAALFRKGYIPCDVALIQVSPPDKHGYCSLGIAVDTVKAALQVAKKVIAQVNRKMPRTHGDGLIHVDKIDYLIEKDEELPELKPHPPTPIETEIGKNCAALVDDGATLQMGIGAIPDAVLSSLTGHRRLGIHTEMFAEGVIDLIEKGVVTGEDKKIHPGKIVASFLMGTRRLWNFVDDNPLVQMLDVAYVNDTAVIKRNPKVTAINSAIEIDLTGQVCADSIGERMFSGVGGQMDFIRGASLSEGGKPIIALPSVTKKGESRIVPVLKPGAGVVTTRAHIHYVVTEYGCVNLYGKSLRQRAKALIDISHPKHKEWLEKEAIARFRGL